MHTDVNILNFKHPSEVLACLLQCLAQPLENKEAVGEIGKGWTWRTGNNTKNKNKKLAGLGNSTRFLSKLDHWEREILLFRVYSRQEFWNSAKWFNGIWGGTETHIELKKKKPYNQITRISVNKNKQTVVLYWHTSTEISSTEEAGFQRRRHQNRFLPRKSYRFLICKNNDVHCLRIKYTSRETGSYRHTQGLCVTQQYSHLLQISTL